MRYGLIAQHLGHSFSAELHALIGRYAYELREIAPDELRSFLTSQEFAGVNVTIPYKQAVLPYLDQISDTARAIGAVNTIVRRNGKLCGYNTDFGGMSAMIRRMGLTLRGKKVLILGTGGTGKTARAVAEAHGAERIISVSRSDKSGAVTYEEAYRCHGDADVIINTTPCGMFPDLDTSPVDLAPFTSLQGVADAVYNPLSTPLVCDARLRGIPAQGGLYMLVRQAVMSAELFTGERFDPDPTDRIYGQMLQQKRSIVLVGMPGCGKSSVGAKIAQMLRRSFVDLDQLIVSRAGKTVPELFRENGEDHFRSLESLAVREVAGQTGLVIATGGGSVLRRENVELLRRNGLIFFLDRPIAHLKPTVNRPLADSADKISVLYVQRLPIYQAASDHRIPVDGGIDDTAMKVIRLFQEVHK